MDGHMTGESLGHVGNADDWGTHAASEECPGSEGSKIHRDNGTI
jgi:hypothetical protein